MQDKYTKAIQKAKDLLTKNPRDQGHDLQHHKEVWQLCQKIMAAEKIKLNTKILQVAAFWHDVVVGEEKWPSQLMVDDTCAYLEKTLLDLDFLTAERTSIIAAIQFHEFRARPITVEGLVLQDADKLAVLSEDRWEHSLQAFKSGQMSEEKLKSYCLTFLKWLPILSATFHFATSRVYAQQRITSFWQSAEWSKVISDLGIQNEYEHSKKTMSSLRTNMLRVFIRCYNLVTRLKISMRS